MPSEASMKAARALYDAAGYGYPNAGDIAAALDAAYERGRAEERERCAGIAFAEFAGHEAARDRAIADGRDTVASHRQTAAETALAIATAIKGDTP